MVEYGGVVRQGSGVGGGTGSFDVMGWLSDLVDRIAALPPEVLLLVAATVVVSGFVMFRRTA